MSASLEKYTKKYFGDYLNDDSITEICYNGDNKIWTQNFNGFWECNESELNVDGASAFAQASGAFKEDQINQAKPIMSCVLVSGERVQIVMPPATKREHISITIRKPSKIRYTIEDYKKAVYLKALKHKIAAKIKRQMI